MPNNTQDFIQKHRVQLLTERNEYRMQALLTQQQLATEREITMVVITMLMLLIMVLLGVLLYVIYS